MCMFNFIFYQKLTVDDSEFVEIDKFGVKSKRKNRLIIRRSITRRHFWRDSQIQIVLEPARHWYITIAIDFCLAKVLFVILYFAVYCVVSFALYIEQASMLNSSKTEVINLPKSNLPRDIV